MKQSLAVVFACSVLLSPWLGGCATRPAPEFAGRWTPVNRFPSSPQAIPLHPGYVFYASPLDRTLKGMLERWARDAKMALVYRHPSDFTLYQPVADIHDGDLRQAIAALNTLYAANQVVVAVRDNAIEVDSVPPVHVSAMPAPDANATPAVSANAMETSLVANGGGQTPPAGARQP